MRYFFHVRSNAEAFDDDVGETFSDANQASIQAAVIAGEIAQDDHWTAFSVVVVDELGTEITRVPILDGVQADMGIIDPTD